MHQPPSTSLWSMNQCVNSSLWFRRSLGLLLVLVGLCSAAAHAQTELPVLSGVVLDSVSGQPLAGASVALLSGSSVEGAAGRAFVDGRASDFNGRFAFFVPPGEIIIRVTFVGYASRWLRMNIVSDTFVNVHMVADARALGTATVSASRGAALASVRMGEHRISAADMRATPQVLGEVDGLKTLQLLPGVRGGSEASAGLYVRGGGPDQNLFLIDGLPLYGTTHLFGFFSAFPAEALHSVRLIKGGMPARYGGRLSSVIEIEPRSGSRERFGAQGSLGLLSSQLALDGPLAGGRGAFLLAGRRTLVDLATRALAREEESLHPYFYDGYGRLTYSLGQRTELVASVYSSRDDFVRSEQRRVDRGGRVETRLEQSRLGWSNGSAAIRLLHNGERWQHEVGVGSVSYRLLASYAERIASRSQNESPVTTGYMAAYGSRLQDLRAWGHSTHLWTPGHASNAGITLTRHAFEPAALRVHNTGNVSDHGAPGSMPLPPAFETDAYAEHEATWGAFRASAGVRASWARLETVNSGDLRNHYALQPRLSARYALNESVALKASYTETAQAVHLLVNSTAGLPTELWLPANSVVGPSRSTLWTAGGAYEPSTGPLSGHLFTLEAYLKRQRGVIGYHDGASFADVRDGRWTEVVAQGDAASVGLELFAERRMGRLTGWLGYTLSRTTLAFAELNEGVPFPARFDRRHDVSAVARYTLRPGLTANAAWIYGTGEAVTLPIGELLCPQDTGSPGPHVSCGTLYSARNGVRMPAYHRLDFSVQLGDEDGRVSFSIGLYNAYNRLNAFYVAPGVARNVNYNGSDAYMGAYRRVALFPVLPFARLDFRL